ncbi:MAG: hypothetical protein WA778_21640, partial [Pseudolabrys sp.]
VGFHVWHTTFLCLAPLFEELTVVLTPKRDWREWRVRFGSKADICGATRHVRFTPNSDRESEIPQ